MTTVASQPALLPSYTLNLLSLLTERDASVLGAAIDRLLVICDVAWPQIASSLSSISALAEEEQFPHFRRAALLASKVSFHLEDEAEAMRYALVAGEAFVHSPKDDFSLFVTCRLVDAFVGAAVADAALERLVQSLVFSAVRLGRFPEALGLALEARRADWLHAILGDISDSEISVLDDFAALVRRAVPLSDPRRATYLGLLAGRYGQGAQSIGLTAGSWWFGTLRCALDAGSAEAASKIFSDLLSSEEDPQCGWLLAYQLALDLAEQAYDLSRISLPVEPEEVVANLAEIFSGRFQARLTVDCLHRANKTDVSLLDTLKAASASGVQGASDLVHAAVILAHGLINARTTSDAFLRANLDWLARANLWAKFEATASLGLVHCGHVAQGRAVLSTYLPSLTAPSSRSPYSEGGALFGLGLVFAASADVSTRDYLLTQLGLDSAGPAAGGAGAGASAEVQQYGAALGLGLTAAGRGTSEELERVKALLYADNAVAGEAAGVALGLLSLGGYGDEASGTVEELIRYAQETSHEKISRGCMVGVALCVAGVREKARPVVERLLNDQTDAMARYGGVLALGVAFAESADEYAIRKLLDKAVYDSSDDVKRTSAVMLGLVLAGNKRLGKILGLMADSYNPHLRYGVALGLGIGLTGGAAEEPGVVETLEALTKDTVDFVRQAAWIGLGLVNQQCSSNGSMDKMVKVATTGKGEEGIVRWGAVVGLGVMNVAGRNGSTAVRSRDLVSLAGVALFSQHWFSHSWTLGLGVAAKSSLCVGLNGDLKMPRNFAAKAKTQAAMPFAYPAALKVEGKKVAEAAKPAAVLSVTRTRSKKLGGTPKVEPVVPVPAGGEAAMEVEVTKTKRSGKAEQVVYFNPFRVVRGQEKVVEFFKAEDLMPVRGAKTSSERCHVRYVPLLEHKRSGWLVLRDLRVQETGEDLFEAPAAPAAGPPVVATPAEQPAPPEEFEWNEQ